MKHLLTIAALLVLCTVVTGAMAADVVVDLTLEERVTIIEVERANPFQKTIAHALIDRIEALEKRLHEVAREYDVFGSRDMFRMDQNLKGLIYDLQEIGIPVKERWR